MALINCPECNGKGGLLMYDGDIKQFKDNIATHLEERFGMSKREANKAVSNSAINRLLERDPAMVMHDSIASWSEDIYAEYNNA